MPLIPKQPPKLRSLSRVRLGDEEFAATFQQLEADSDRGAALVASACLDHTLEDALEADFPVKLTSEERDQLFGGDAPLGTFGAKIRFGYAVGLYGKEIRDDLLTVSRVRNVFAHSPKPLTFEFPTIANACRNLKTDAKPQSPRHAFLRFCIETCMALLSDQAHEHQRRSDICSELATLLREGKLTVEQSKAMLAERIRGRQCSLGQEYFQGEN